MSRVLFHVLLCGVAVLPAASNAQTAGQLCWTERPRDVLEVGTVARARVGLGRAHALMLDTCDPDAAPAVVWYSRTPGVVMVQPGGELRALAAGAYHIVGVAGRDTIERAGAVLPVGWRIRLAPMAATVAVGDTVTFHAEAVSPDGSALFPVRYSLYTREFEADGPELPVLLTDVASHQGVLGPVRFIARRPGVTAVRAVIGGQHVSAPLRITRLP